MNINKLSLLLILILTSTSYISAQELTREAYILKYQNIAVQKMRSHGIPASITLAQGCLESGNGNSKLAVEGRNHFGIKCHEWKGATIRVDDDIKNECFRKYKKAEESYADHGDFLRYRPRYSFLFDLEITDYKGWAYGLKKAGYATNPQYPQLLIKIIEENKLYQYDIGNPVLDKINPIPPSPSSTNSLKEYHASFNSPFSRLAKIRKIYTLNNVPYIIAKEGDTYKNLARESGLFLRELVKYNDLDKVENISPGSKIYLNKKRSKAKRHSRVHVAKEGDTYYDISQDYGIRLIKVYKYNDVKSNQTIPNSGEEIYLRNHKHYYW